ncbi:helix-turn-helix transcriptional regulator [Ktedonospora formicarum]|uniref:Transcriptional regulator n=1 Tax=Ktedonospora formicarum TaxID=2778364 RepID=A0A8J3MWV4_9CHLR|nr:YafY family protein [Ktedonospora formicarum]GHO47960.1 transcriptional regulator [Ktedonospora formicarum]
MVYRPTARVLTVLELLQSYGRMTGPELANRLEVNVRTVRDYIETLIDLGIPVEAERGRYGAYRLRPGYKLPPLIFTEDEALALTLSLLAARETGLAQTSPAFEGSLAKIERVLPSATRERVQAVEQTVVFENSTPYATPSFPIVMALSSAVQGECCIYLHYRSPSGETTERTFEPYGVVSHDGYWYTIGYCRLRQRRRLLRVDRIIQADVTDEPFQRPPNFDTLAEVQRALATVPRAWRIEVWLETTLQEAQGKTRLSKGHFTEVDGGVLVHSEVQDLPWMASLLAGLDIPFVIHHPPELRTALREHALTMLRYAEQ